MNHSVRKEVLKTALNEIKKSKREKRIIILLASLAVFSTLILLFLISFQQVLTGYASYVEGKAGYLTKITLTQEFPTTYWHGIYGLGLRVPGFIEQLQKTVGSGEITRQDLFFECLQADAVGGNEIYASTSDFIDFESLEPATPAMIDSFLGCSGKVDCASNTFKKTMSVMVGAQNITNIPSTHTYKWDGDYEVFSLGILKDSMNNLVFVTTIKNLQRGYNPNVTVNFQLLLPVPAGQQKTYYFFTDPFDTCPQGGGIGDVLVANIYGYVRDESGNPIENASVIFRGFSKLTDANGFYNLSIEVLAGTYNLISMKTGFDDYISDLNISFSNSVIEKNITMKIYTPGFNQTINPIIDGYVRDIFDRPLSLALVKLGGSYSISDANGYYSLNPTILPESHPIIAILEGYNNYYAILNFTKDTIYLSHNITLEEFADLQDMIFETGPYTEEFVKVVQTVQVEQARERGEDYWISTKEIFREVRHNTFVEESVGLYGFKSGLNLVFSLSPEIEDFIKLDKPSLSLPIETFGELKLIIYGTKPLGEYNGSLIISGTIEKEIPIRIRIVERRVPVETLLLKLDLSKSTFYPGEKLNYRITFQNLIRDHGYLVDLFILLENSDKEVVFTKEIKNFEVKDSVTLIDEINLPRNLSEGEYVLRVDANYLDYLSSASTPLNIQRPIYLYSFLGIPFWIYLVIISTISFISLNLFLYKRSLEKKKRYQISLDKNTLPKPGARTIKVGKIAETNTPAYYEIDKLTTHAIIAGATGMGKSISAQVIIEEALMQNIAVIVFDPTAQWSGMLRKCEDKRMISLYPSFGLKPKDARGFPGNIREVRDAREIIDINRYVEPGHIQIFTMNKLDPSKIDIFIANVIREIFKSDPKESPDLKVILVFDEVHRLLSKFGGSGEGFLQIERGCREFRKWGIGIMLLSQVLSDFVGEIKANINTEVQTRTLEENDLERIKTKYGEQFLKSLVRAEVGNAMFQNADYNLGRPYFIHFRPILHNTRRLSDEELEKYNKYNDTVDDLGYQIEQLEEEKIDVFDLKMELKLVKDKIMTGNFSVVDIYLEGLTPRVNSQWEKLGKKPKKRVIKLADINEIKASVEEAKKERAKAEKAAKAKEVKTEEKKEKEEKIEDKILTALTFDNGLMVSSLKELKSIIPNMDDEIFNIHVNEKKNDIAKWIEQISKEEAEKIAPIKTKKEMIVALENIGKKQPEKPEVKKDVKSEKEKTEVKTEDKEKSEKEKSEVKTEAKPEKEKTELNVKSPEKKTEGVEKASLDKK
jgi:hypothetical protein